MRILNEIKRFFVKKKPIAKRTGASVSVQHIADMIASVNASDEKRIKAILEAINSFTEGEKKIASIDANIDEITGTNYRIFTMTDWLNAMRCADVPFGQRYQPNWSILFDLFSNMLTDPHVQSCVDILSEGVKSQEFYVTDENGDKDDEASRIFNQKWFYDFIDIRVNARLWGFSLAQITEINRAEKILKIKEVNRKFVRPDLEGVVEHENDTQAFRFWNKAPYKYSTVFNFDSKLGKFNSCVRWWIYKTEVARLWAKYNQVFAIPPVIVKTSLKDGTRRENAISGAKSWATSNYLVMDESDEVEMGAGGSAGTANAELFESLMRYCDEQISKALLGSTMTNDDGSSRSQAEVHQETTDSFVESIRRAVLFNANDDIIPMLKHWGLVTNKKLCFHWDKSEKMSMKDRSEILNNACVNYSVDIAIASDFLGLELQEREDEPEVPPVVKKTLEDLYKKNIDLC